MTEKAVALRLQSGIELLCGTEEELTLETSAIVPLPSSPQLTQRGAPLKNLTVDKSKFHSECCSRHLFCLLNNSTRFRKYNQVWFDFSVFSTDIYSLAE